MKERQTSFVGGEASPSLWGRTDWQKYGSSARTLLNFFVSPDGSLLNRPGSSWVENIGPVAAVRLMPFVFSDTDSLLLVFTPGALRYFRYNSTVGRVTELTVTVTFWNTHRRRTIFDIDSSGSYEWTAADLPLLRVNQIGNELRIIIPSAGVRELSRASDDSLTWEYSKLDFEVPDFPSYGGTPRVFPNGSDAGPPTSYGDPTYLDGDTDHPPLPWQWQVTRIMQKADGSFYETKPYTLTKGMTRYFRWWSFGIYPSGNNVIHTSDTSKIYQSNTNTTEEPGAGSEWTVFTPADFPGAGGTYHLISEWDLPEAGVAVYPDHPVTLDWNVWPFAPETIDSDADRIISTRIYRGQDGRFGFLAEVKDPGPVTTPSSKSARFIDYGDEPDWSRPPPQSTNPFEIYDAEETLIRTEIPSAVSMYEGRTMFGGTAQRPGLVLGSAVDDFANFDEVNPAKDSDSLSFTLSTNKYERIRAIIPRDRLIVLTDSSEWFAGGSGLSELISPNSIAARPFSKHGCGTLEPLDFGGTVLWVQPKGTVPRAVLIDDNGVRKIDVHTVSRHLFRGHSIVDWCYAEDPWSLIWAVREDGILLTCTYVPEHELVAWARHEISGGTVEAIASIPEGLEDSIYLAVRRGDDIHLERLASRDITDVREAIFVDGSVTVRDQNASTLSFVQFHSGEVTEPEMQFTGVQTVGTVIQVEDPDGGDPIRMQIAADLGGNIYQCVIEGGSLSDGMQDTAADLDFVECFSSVTGLTHLEGLDVMALIDGYVAGPFTVNAGAVDLGQSAAIAHVGLAYNADFLSMASEMDKAKKKTVRSVIVETYGTRGGFIGSDLDGARLEEMRSRQVTHNYGLVPLLREERELILGDVWAEKATVAVRQSDPLPLEILGITRDIILGGW